MGYQRMSGPKVGKQNLWKRDKTSQMKVKIVLTGYVAGLLCCSFTTCIGGGQRVVLLLEVAGKIFRIVEANLIGNL